jgi:hypothetical protein
MPFDSYEICKIVPVPIVLYLLFNTVPVYDVSYF